MSPPRRGLTVCLICSSVFVSGISLAQESAQTYPELRKSLLATGWKPDVGYGLKIAGGKPMHRFPEVLCGPARCNAKWRNRDGTEKLFWMVRGGGKEDYRVTPE